jgi:hypothetical protein
MPDLACGRNARNSVLKLAVELKYMSYLQALASAYGLTLPNLTADTFRRGCPPRCSTYGRNCENLEMVMPVERPEDDSGCGGAGA